jgi:hypothetical protein
VSVAPILEGVTPKADEGVIESTAASSSIGVCPLCGDAAAVTVAIRVRAGDLDVTGAIGLCVQDAEYTLGIAPAAIERTGTVRARTTVGAARDLLAAAGIPSDDLAARRCDHKGCTELAIWGARLVPEESYAHRAGPLVSFFCDQHAGRVLPHARLLDEPWRLRPEAADGQPGLDETPPSMYS